MTHARQHTIQVVAHRGASEDAPEHTLAAYMKAIEDGADALECDVRLTADGHLVCVHDRRVNRTSNGRGAVSALELADLAALDFGSWRDSEESPDWVPGRNPGGHGELTSVLTLERLLELVSDAGRPVELAIETKHPTRWAGQVEERLVHLLRRFGLDAPAADGPSPVRVMSFSARSLMRMAAAAPSVPTVYLMQFLSPRLRDGRLPAGARIAGPGIRLVRNNPGYVARLQRAGHRVHVWTVNEPQDIELCVSLGVEAIITNRPKQALSQLGRL
ncbi:glycerophosphodiester phosphodiesterase [Streptomyces hypolithicus]